MQPLVNFYYLTCYCGWRFSCTNSYLFAKVAEDAKHSRNFSTSDSVSFSLTLRA